MYILFIVVAVGEQTQHRCILNYTPRYLVYQVSVSCVWGLASQRHFDPVVYQPQNIKLTSPLKDMVKEWDDTVEGEEYVVLRSWVAIQ